MGVLLAKRLAYMKIASSSASFDRDLRAGDLTQLEWLDVCVAPLKLDGVVFDARHFPRTDDEYLAQLKKMCVDRGLTVAALASDALFESDEQWFDIAVRLGAPLLIARTPPLSDAASAWNEVAAKAKRAASAAKRANVTIAIRNAPGTFCEDAAGLKRLAKDTDSAWIRYASDPARLPPIEPLDTLLPRTVIALHDIDTTASGSGALEDAALLSSLRVFRGFLVLDDPVRQGGSEALACAVEEQRAGLAASACELALGR